MAPRGVATIELSTVTTLSNTEADFSTSGT
jgi:hypothetical protein